MLYSEERKKLCRCVKLIYNRKLTNNAGGNVTVKVDENRYLMTPTLMAARYHCDLSPNQILVIDFEGNVIEGDGNVTREINMHQACYRANPSIKCVIHAHAPKSMFFASVGLDMPNLTEATYNWGEIKCLEFQPATTLALANIVERQVLQDRQSDKAYLLNKHGVLVLSTSLEDGMDFLERLEWNAEIAYKYLVAEKLGIKMDLADLSGMELVE